jgi:5-methylcytosine-specific restriction endonuclease McrA
VDRECLDLIEAARDALSHSHPDATSNDILKAALRVLISDREKKTKRFVAKPRKEPPPSRTDVVPADVRRAVWKRDEGKCQWPLASGGICGCTKRVQLAHRDPRARGGPPTLPNLRLLCRFHNQYEARLQLGDALMDRFTRKRTAAPSAPTSTANQPCLDLGP